MDSPAPSLASPYLTFPREQWASLRADTPLTLGTADIDRLRSLNDPLDLAEVEAIYLPISRLLSLYVAATQQLFRATKSFLGSNNGKVPYVIGIGGSVAVGKSTTARLLQALLGRWPNVPKVDLVTTDGFLYSNAVLAARGLMERKGFPESYNVSTLLRFLSAIKAGQGHVAAPVYSHLVYDIQPGEAVVIDRPDILIVEGLNVLQVARPPRDGKAIPFVSDYFDFSIYIDADEAMIREWYVERFMRLRATAFRDPKSYFRKYAGVPEAEAREMAERLWSRINLPNLRENILPTRYRAGLVLRKAADHRIEEVALRRL